MERELKEIWFMPSLLVERAWVRLYLNYFANPKFDLGKEF
jgi:hypothetical protein